MKILVGNLEGLRGKMLGTGTMTGGCVVVDLMISVLKMIRPWTVGVLLDLDRQ
jgi:hypothetical protein